MKNKIMVFATLMCSFIICTAQESTGQKTVFVGTFINQYNGNLGTSLFKFNTTCYAGVTAGIIMPVTTSFSAEFSGVIGRYGYCQTDADRERTKHYEQQCPGCTGQTGMGELRSQIASINAGMRYEFANGYVLPIKSKLTPYLFLGAGLNHLSDVMQRNCVNEGFHMSFNGGGGFDFSLTKQVRISYHLGMGAFPFKKVYASESLNEEVEVELSHDPIEQQLERRKDFYMQNTLRIGYRL